MAVSYASRDHLLKELKSGCFSAVCLGYLVSRVMLSQSFQPLKSK